jgi:hypothetical protein
MPPAEPDHVDDENRRFTAQTRAAHSRIHREDLRAAKRHFASVCRRSTLPPRAGAPDRLSNFGESVQNLLAVFREFVLADAVDRAELAE